MRLWGVEGREGWNWEPLGYIMCHSPVRKLYSTVSKSTTIPGRKIGLLMFACHSSCVCTACVNARMTYPVCANTVRYANKSVDRQVGKTIKMLGLSVLIRQTFLSPTPSTEYKINTFRLLNSNDCYQDVKRLSTRITKKILKTITYYTFKETWTRTSVLETELIFTGFKKVFFTLPLRIFD